LFTWSRRVDDSSSACRSRSACRRRERRMRSAFSLFWSWLFSSWQVTTRRVGRCVMRTAESVVLTDWPPGPLDRYTSTSRSLGSMSMSTTSASGSTAAVAALGCTRPWLSVAGTRCTRWGPAFCLRRGHAGSRRPPGGGRAGRHPTLALRRRHALYAMGTGFVLEPRPRVRAFHDERDVAVPAHLGRLARQHFEAPPSHLGVPAVHLEQVARPEVGLVAALRAADLHDHVLTVVGVPRDQQLLERCLELGEAALALGELALQVFAHLRVALRRQQLAGV